VSIVSRDAELQGARVAKGRSKRKREGPFHLERGTSVLFWPVWFCFGPVWSCFGPVWSCFGAVEAVGHVLVCFGPVEDFGPFWSR
jgi:hypothetical protein